MRSLLVSCLLTIFVGLAQAETLHVNNIAGSDRNSGSIGTNMGDGIGPLRTIAVAVKRANRGDRIELANTGQSYEECITLQGRRNSGTPFSPFVIEGNGATIDGTAEIPVDRWEFTGGTVYRFVPGRLGYQSLFIDGEVAEQLPRLTGASPEGYLKPQQWCRCNGQIYFAAEKGRTPGAYDMRYAKHRVGITLYDVKHVRIRNLIVQGFQLDGINAHDNAMDCVLSELTATDNGRSGVSVGGASRVRVVDSVLYGNGSTQLNAEGWSTTRLIRTRMAAEDNPIWVRTVNSLGRGARIYVDGTEQTQPSGWATDEDKEAVEQFKARRAEDAAAQPAPEPIEADVPEPGDVPEPPMEEEPDAEEGEQPTPPAEEEQPMLDDPFEDDTFGDEPGLDEPLEDDPFADEI